uniref:C-C motif chemokine 25 isoform X1 n=2 Tax=Myodes glareolus TaxID=447135 RepID=UPI0020203056|nr:C-C motif chemokine 25 isoform X1 [Myodes glareolus]
MKQYTLQAGASSPDHNGTGGPTQPSGTWRRDLVCTMKLWLFACLVACFVGAWVPAVHAQGAFEDCCLGYQSNLKWSILKRAKCYRKQEVSGSCNLPAVIFYFRQKGLVCANPEDKDVKRILLPRNKPAGSPRKCTPAGSHTERKKSNHAKSKLGNLRITSRRNATLGRPRVVRMTRKITH